MTGPSDLTEQKERLAVLLNDRALVRKDTMQSRASAEADEVRGRFAQINKATVVGTTAAPPDYAAPNWAHDPTGVEPPLGFDVNEVPLCGEAFEIERSLQAHCNDAEGWG